MDGEWLAVLSFPPPHPDPGIWCVACQAPGEGESSDGPGEPGLVLVPREASGDGGFESS